MKATKKAIIGKRFSQLDQCLQEYIRTEARQSPILEQLIREDEVLTRYNYLMFNGITESQMGVELEAEIPWVFTKPQPRLKSDEYPNESTRIHMQSKDDEIDGYSEQGHETVSVIDPADPIHATIASLSGEKHAELIRRLMKPTNLQKEKGRGQG